MDRFQQRKQDVLSRPDKSSIGGWDKRIIDLCREINKDKNYCTTSSCSGRIILMIEQEKKAEGLFLKVYHELGSIEQIKKDLSELCELSKKKKISIKFKQEPAILHIACVDLDSTQKLYDSAKSAGWKHSGLISWNGNFVLELLNTERLEFPVICEGEILVSDEFLRICIEKTNRNLKKNWEKIERLREHL